MKMLKQAFSSPGSVTVPLGVITFLLGVSAHFSKVEAQSQENNQRINSHQQDISQIRARQDDYNKIVSDISNRLSRIEGSLEGLKQDK